MDINIFAGAHKTNKKSAKNIFSFLALKFFLKKGWESQIISEAKYFSSFCTF